MSKPFIQALILMGLISWIILSLTTPTYALPTGYKFKSLGCTNLAGLPMPNIVIDTHVDAVGDYLARHTSATYESTDLQGTQIGYTSSDASIDRYGLTYDLHQNYNEGNPTIDASHIFETTGYSISTEEAGVAYTDISANASNVESPSAVALTSGFTSMMTGPSTYIAKTDITNSLTTDGQPTAISMHGELTGLGEDEYGDGATFWNWEATYHHGLYNHLDDSTFDDQTGNESTRSYEFGMTGGDHKVTYSMKGDISSKVEALLFPKQEPDSDDETIEPTTQSSTQTNTQTTSEYNPEYTGYTPPTTTEVVDYNPQNITSTNITSNSTYPNETIANYVSQNLGLTP